MKKENESQELIDLKKQNYELEQKIKFLERELNLIRSSDEELFDQLNNLKGEYSASDILAVFKECLIRLNERF